MANEFANRYYNIQYVFSGYCGDPTFLREICQVYKQLKEKNKDLIYGLFLLLQDQNNSSGS